uniref:3-hydroxyisobutyrate dehydrogenase, mitochondrial n=1 Tax=Bos mutus grunniens TaxID=30521 RepID=A0A8B9W7P1_BOSMU
MAASLRLRGAASGLRYWSRRQPPAVASLAAVCSRSMASKTPVGFIGVGNMGNPMAKNLMKHGYPLIIYDVFPDACKEFLDAGEQVVSSPADVAEKADRIITMLPTSINAIEAYSGANGILKKVKKGSLLIDSSTIDPMVSKELAKEVEKMGAVFMDAPVSGGVGAARSGNLTFMVGGVEEEFAAAQELLGCMGSNVVYCGAVGTGQAAKICNNLLLAISMIGTAEAMNLGIRAVLIGSEEPQQIQCWQMTPLFARRRLVCSQQQPTTLTSRQLQTWEGMWARTADRALERQLMYSCLHSFTRDFFPKQTTIKKSEWKNVYRVLN